MPPLAWLLFFAPDDIHLTSRWGRLYFVCDWETAKTRFLFRLPLLLIWFQNEFSRSQIKNFLDQLESLIATASEIFLVLDPSELGIDEHNAIAMRSALIVLNNPLLSEEEKFSTLDAWSHSKSQQDANRRYADVFGVYYGGYFDV